MYACLLHSSRVDVDADCQSLTKYLGKVSSMELNSAWVRPRTVFDSSLHHEDFGGSTKDASMHIFGIQSGG